MFLKRFWMYPRARDRHGSKSISFVMYKGCIIASDDILHFMGQDKLYILLLSDLLSAHYIEKYKILEYFKNPFLWMRTYILSFSLMQNLYIYTMDTILLRWIEIVSWSKQILHNVTCMMIEGHGKSILPKNL